MANPASAAKTKNPSFPPLKTPQTDSLKSARIKLKPSVKYLKTQTEFIKEEFQKFMESKEAQRMMESATEEGGEG